MKYPIGIQDFRSIREGGYVYIDKTALIGRLTNSGKYFFLSRPRRFGKSLLISVLKELYSGSKELFQGLWIENHWNWGVKHPVIHLRFAKSDYQGLGLERAIVVELYKSAAEIGVELTGQTVKGCFEDLINKACAALGKVVILIDEYDKPIIDYLDDAPKAVANRDILKQFYSVVKDADACIEFLFLTGVSKFTKVSIFSDLNHLTDITLLPQYNTITGITQSELQQYFALRLSELSATQPELIERLKSWYNGYNWGGDETVYNPFSLLNYLQNGVYNNYWFETGTPAFLVKMVRDAGHFDQDEDAFASLLSLANFDIEAMEYQTILFQTGYLTFKEVNYEEGWCKLKYPNTEVKMAFQQMLLAAWRHHYTGEALPLVLRLRLALEENDIEKVIQVINTVFASIPYDLWKNASELHYHALVHLTFSLLGNYINSEVNSAQGRCDAIVKTATHIYAFEFKLDQSAEAAIQQIRDKRYLDPYSFDPRRKVAVGVNFSSAKRSVEEFDAQDWQSQLP